MPQPLQKEKISARRFLAKTNLKLALLLVSPWNRRPNWSGFCFGKLRILEIELHTNKLMATEPIS